MQPNPIYMTPMRISKVCTLVIIGLVPQACLWAGESPALKETTIFAFDDHSIPWKENLTLTLVQPTKRADNPVVARGKEGTPDEWAVQFYGSVLRHNGKFKMWYIAADEKSLELIRKGKGFTGLRPAYAESDDGIHWKKPELGLVELGGNRRNNLVQMDPHDACGIHLIVIREEEEPDPKRRFKMLLTVLSRLEGKRTVSISVVFFSHDGLRWRGGSQLGALWHSTARAT